MAMFRINKHLLADPINMAALHRSFTTLEEYKPGGEGSEEHKYFKWFRVTGPGIPEDDTEIELEFILSPKQSRVDIKWQKKII